MPAHADGYGFAKSHSADGATVSVLVGSAAPEKHSVRASSPHRVKGSPVSTDRTGRRMLLRVFRRLSDDTKFWIEKVAIPTGGALLGSAVTVAGFWLAGSGDSGTVTVTETVSAPLPPIKLDCVVSPQHFQ
jgi:hypothetical protein